MPDIGLITRIPQTIRNLQRLRDIVTVVARYGFDELVARLGLEGLVDKARRLLRMPPRAEDGVQRWSFEERVRMVIEELGPTFIKFGQILATRPDLLPMNLIVELRKLQDDVPPFPSDEAIAVIEAELGGPVGSFFASFDEKPLAAASIAQVHTAVLPSGEKVVVKVQRPGLQKVIANDLEILRFLAEALHDNVAESRQYDPRGLVANFAQSIVKEIDFTREAYNIVKFRENFRDVPWMKVPEVHADLSTSRIVTMEFIDGIKASDLEAIDAAGLDRKLLASRGTEAVLKMVFVDGFFHADPHPGNIFLLPGNVFCLIDFGMMGTVDDERIGELLEFLVGLLTGDMDRVVTLFHRLGLVDDQVDVRALKSECRAILDRYGNQTLESIDIATFLTEVFETVRRHHVSLPSDLLIMAKSVVTMEGIAQELHPGFDPLAEMRTYLLRVYTKRTMDPGHALKGLYGTIDAYSYLLQRLPREVESIATKLRKGELTIRLDETERLRSARSGERALGRLAMAILYLATAVCSTMLLVSPLGPEFLGVPATTILGMLGLLLALGLGAVALLGSLFSD
jgi:ubiquinone biosynthesis protein